MANIPSYAERLDIQRQVQEICKTKGQYARKKFPSFDSFVKFFSNKYRSMKDSIFSCIKNLKTLINEYIKWAQQGLDVTTEYALMWFKGYLNLILKAAKHGIKMADAFYNRVLKRKMMQPTKEGIISGAVNYLGKPLMRYAVGPVANGLAALGTYAATSAVKGAIGVGKYVLPTAVKYAATDAIYVGAGYLAYQLIFGGVLLGIICSVITIAISWWMRITHKADFQLATNPSLLDKTKYVYNKKLANNKGELPDNLLPPEPEVPNITMSFMSESANFREDATTIGAGIIFLLFLKASIASVYNEEMAQKTKVLKSAIPGPATLAFTGLVLYFATHSASFISA